MEPDPKSGYVLSSLAEVVERILGFLPTKALLRAACVCQLWRECSRRILRTQQSITWVSALEPDPSNSHILVHTLAEDIEKVQVLPQTVLYIISDAETFSENREISGLKKARRRYSKEIAAALEKLLPARCQVLGLATPGVVVTPKGSGSHRPLEVEEGEAGFALLFPKIDGVKIQTFHFFKDLKSQGIDEGQAVLLFGYNSWKTGSTRFFRQIVNRLNEKSIILAGGYLSPGCNVRRGAGHSGHAAQSPSQNKTGKLPCQLSPSLMT
ncbi:putative F-box only protein, partial [Naja naja]